MGELIRKVGTINIGEQSFDVEINVSTSDRNQHEIHIQNDKARLALTEKQFCKMATCILLARRQLHQIKEIDK